MSSQSKSRNPLRKLAESLRVLRERHGERHRPSGFGFAFADRVNFLNRETWDNITANGSLFLRRDVLRVLEQHGPENVLPRYALIFREEKPVFLKDETRRPLVLPTDPPRAGGTS